MQGAATKADGNKVGESLKDDDIKETKAEKEKNNFKKKSATFVEHLSFMKKVYLTMFLIFTIFAQSVTFGSMFLNHFFVTHKLELFNCENCENLFKTKDYLASLGITIHNKCHICGKIFKNINTITKHYVK